MSPRCPFRGKQLISLADGNQVSRQPSAVSRPQGPSQALNTAPPNTPLLSGAADPSPPAEETLRSRLTSESGKGSAKVLRGSPAPCPTLLPLQLPQLSVQQHPSGDPQPESDPSHKTMRGLNPLSVGAERSKSLLVLFLIVPLLRLGPQHKNVLRMKRILCCG